MEGGLNHDWLLVQPTAISRFYTLEIFYTDEFYLYYFAYFGCCFFH